MYSDYPYGIFKLYLLKKLFPSPRAGGNRINVWLMEGGPNYGLDSSTALWISWESEMLAKGDNPDRKSR